MKDGNLKWALVAGVLLALLVSPFALGAGGGNSFVGGKRNPTSRSQSFRSTTQLVAATTGYAMRITNRSRNGGGEFDRCNSGPGGTPKKQEPCVRGSNGGTGYAFEFDTRGTQGGTINVSKPGDTAKPFTTNATGVATGLNAERVGSQTPAQLTNNAVAAVQGTLSFALVFSPGTLGPHRGVDTAGHASAGLYNVAFHNPVNNCAITATESEAGTEAGAVGVQLGPDNKTVTVSTFNSANPVAQTDHAFYITAIC